MLIRLRKENIVQKHKWYNEIVAWASGAEIEYYSNSVWLPWHEHVGWFDEYEYRIKPQPKKPQYLYVYRTSTNGQIEYRLYHDINAGGVLLGKIKLEVNDE